MFHATTEVSVRLLDRIVQDVPAPGTCFDGIAAGTVMVPRDCAVN